MTTSTGRSFSRAAISAFAPYMLRGPEYKVIRCTGGLRRNGYSSGSCRPRGASAGRARRDPEGSMAETTRTLIDTRREQMFPTLEAIEIDRLRRFGELRHYAPGAALVRVGEPGHGLTIILAGRVNITRRREAAASEPIVSHGPGSFMGELAQLSGRPALVDAH